MRTFVLERNEDETGISGTGIVAEGIQFTNGKCAMSWLTDVTSVAIYGSLEDLEKIHGHGGKTKVVFSTVVKCADKGLLSVIGDILTSYSSHHRDHGDIEKRESLSTGDLAIAGAYLAAKSAGYENVIANNPLEPNTYKNLWPFKHKWVPKLSGKALLIEAVAYMVRELVQASKGRGYTT
jgi:hypothetical protein